MSAYKAWLKLFAICLILGLALLWTTNPTKSHSTSVKADTHTSTNIYSFEAPQVHPLAITPDGTNLLALNTPDARLSVFQRNGDALKLVSEIPVGLEPVSIAVRNNNEVWVANWLSDSISIVNLTTGNVTRTIDVGDEPTDILFTGAQNETAWVCVSGTRQVKMFDANSLTENKSIEIAGKQPRSLAKDPNGDNIFVSVFQSGNQTSIVSSIGVQTAGGLPAANPAMSPSLPPAPQTGLIVKRKGKKWADETGNTKWTKFVLNSNFSDNDIVILDAHQGQVKAQVTSVGTHIGNSIFDPASNRLFVVNTDSKNIIRFEPKVKGRFIDTRVSKISFNGNKFKSEAMNLNPHINYDSAGSDAERALSLALPTDIARDNRGNFYVTATGSGRVGVLNSEGQIQTRINVGEGPTGLAIDNGQQRLYVLNRFEQTISTIDTQAQKELSRVAVGYNPEPDFVRAGRKFVYDGAFSAHGDISCGSCHRNSHTDGLAWDLGDPNGQLQIVKTKLFVNPTQELALTLHPMKGPMTTQSFRGIIGTEPLHWRGDRDQLKDFKGAFQSLLGGRAVTDEEMASFESFINTLTYPPNPLENPDRTYSSSAEHGRSVFLNNPTDGRILTCNFCHSTVPGFGTDQLLIPNLLLGRGEPQHLKVPQLRGMYQKVTLDSKGNRLASFGYLHDGVIDSLDTFLRLGVFNFNNDTDRKDVEQFLLSFDTGTAPSVGLQITVNDSNKSSMAVMDRIAILMSQAEAKNIDLIVKGRYQGLNRGLVYVGNGMFQTDRSGEPMVGFMTLIQIAGQNSELTFTGVPLGTGRRLGIDHDNDGKLDLD